MLTRHGILRERFADTLTDAVRASLLRIQGYRVDVMQFVESKHTPRNTLLRAVRTGGPVSGGAVRAGVRRPGRDLGDPAQARRAARWPMRERYLLGLTAVPFVVAALLPGRSALGRRRGHPVPGPRDRRVQRARRRRRAARDRPTTRATAAALFTVDPATGETVGRHAVVRGSRGRRGAGAGRRRRGLGRRHRRQPRRPRLGLGRRGCRSGAAATSTRRRTSWSTRRAPATPSRCWPTRATGRLYVVSKGVFGGRVYAAPRAAVRRPAEPARARSGRCSPIATDAAFFPDGRHIIVRNYTEAAVYSWPDLEEVGQFGLPHQQQGEGIAVAPDGTIYASSEGLHAPVLRISLPAAVRRAMVAAGSHADADADARRPSPTPGPNNRVGKELPEAAARGAVRVGLGPGRAARRRHRARAGPGAAAALSRSPLRARWTTPGFPRVGRMVRLRRSSPDQRGWTRRRAGKGFVYLDDAGKRLSAEDAQRVKDLVIPPAWQDVWVCPWPNGHLQAVGTDDAGPAAVPLPPRLADPPRRREVREDAVVRQGAVEGARAGAASTWAPRA